MISRDLLRQRIIEQTATITRFANENIVLDQSGILYWPKQNTLVVSDLHFEKASFLNTNGNSLPELDTLDTLERLADCLNVYRPNKLICLGDSFHDHNAWSRFPEHLKQKLLGLIDSVEQWIWIQGNHDPEIPSELPGEKFSEYRVGDIGFCHHPATSDVNICDTRTSEDNTVSANLIFGHFHPKYKTSHAGQTLSGKCFLQGSKFIVMPSFGSFTGGLWVSDEPLALYYNAASAVHLLFNAHILTLDISIT